LASGIIELLILGLSSHFGQALLHKLHFKACGLFSESGSLYFWVFLLCAAGLDGVQARSSSNCNYG